VDLSISSHIKTKNPAFYAGSLGLKVVRREGIKPATLGLKALVSLGC
jgi:hypothetical protein